MMSGWTLTQNLNAGNKLMKCPHCNKTINPSEYAKHFASLGGKAGGKIGGKSKSEKKKQASRLNGKLGGRPKKKTK